MSRRFWVWLFVAVLIVTVGLPLFFYITDDRFGRDEPNYTVIEEGLAMGGYLYEEPPPGTQAVLNLCEQKDPYQADVHLWEPIHDGTPVPDLAWLRRMVEFVDTQRQAGRPTYIHCWHGVSRSGLVMVAYVMHQRRLTRDEALAFVRTKRPGARPNPAFMALLLEWERELGVMEQHAK